MEKNDSYWSDRYRKLKDQNHRQNSEFDAWSKKTLDPWNQKTGYQEKEFTNSSNIPVKEVYNSKDIPEDTEKNLLGMPGEYPFTRGIYPNMYRGRLWTMRMFSGFYRSVIDSEGS